MAAHTTRKLIADLDSPATCHVRVFRGDHALLQGSEGLGNLPSRPRRILALDRAVVKGSFLVLPICCDLTAPLGRLASLSENVRIERRRRGESKYLPVIRIHRDDRPASGGGRGQVLLRRGLNIEVYCRDQVLAGLRLHDL